MADKEAHFKMLELDVKELERDIHKALETGKYTLPIKRPSTRAADPEVLADLMDVLRDVQTACQANGMNFVFMLEYGYNSERGEWEAVTGASSNNSQTSPHFDSVQEVATEGHEGALPALVRWMMFGSDATVRRSESGDEDGQEWINNGKSVKA